MWTGTVGRGVTQNTSKHISEDDLLASSVNSGGPEEGRIPIFGKYMRAGILKGDSQIGQSNKE